MYIYKYVYTETFGKTVTRKLIEVTLVGGKILVIFHFFDTFLNNLSLLDVFGLCHLFLLSCLKFRKQCAIIEVYLIAQKKNAHYILIGGETG